MSNTTIATATLATIHYAVANGAEVIIRTSMWYGVEPYVLIDGVKYATSEDRAHYFIPAGTVMQADEEGWFTYVVG